MNQTSALITQAIETLCLIFISAKLMVFVFSLSLGALALPGDNLTESMENSRLVTQNLVLNDLSYSRCWYEHR